ncbi:MAG: Gfo/Idh/MocA family oxidoreductase [Acidimicrobiia bacterium]
MTHRAAVAGCGLVGSKRAFALAGADVEVAAVYDTDRNKAEDLASRLPGRVVIAANALEAFSMQGVDIAIVATTHVSLAPTAITALESDCHVLVEKPGASTLAGLTALAEAATQHSRVVHVGFNHRFHPGIAMAKEIVDSEELGSVINVRGRYGHGGRKGYEQEWRADRSVSGGGELIDQGLHLIDLTRFVVGDVALEYSELRTDYWNIDVEDNAFLALRAEGGAFAWLHASWTEWKNLFSFEIALQGGKVEVTGLGGSYGTERLTVHKMLPEMGPPLTTCWEWPQPDESWLREVEDMLEAVEGRSSRGADISDCVAAFHIVDQAYQR